MINKIDQRKTQKEQEMAQKGRQVTREEVNSFKDQNSWTELDSLLLKPDPCRLS
jgi:hypothetical protein